MNKTPFDDLNKAIKSVELEELNKGRVYPCTIINDRYSGAYSGGEWVAFNLDASDVPEEIGASWDEEQVFYQKNDKIIIGIGNTPDVAFNDLLDKLKIYYREKY